MHNVDANGASIPALGFGTWELRGGTAQRLVEAALGIGYRHIDTAQMYGNEAEVGAGIAASGLPRDGLFVTTKVWPDRFRRGVLERSVEESVQRLGLRPDLVLLHWPNPDVPLAETVEALNRVAEQGLTRHIGISNFTTAMIDEAVRLSPRPLVTNQVEYHPFLDQDPVLARCRAHGMALTAYCPLARGRGFSDPLLARIGRGHGKGPGQAALPRLTPEPDHVRCELLLTDLRDLGSAVSRVRRLLDLDADPAAVTRVLGADPALAPVVAAVPGIRVPGTVDGEELVVRALLGERVPASLGEEVPGEWGVTRLFPAAARIATAMPEHAGIVALAEGRLDVHVGRDAAELRAELPACPGIDSATADYVVMRVLGAPDILPAADASALRGAEALGISPDSLPERAREWTPWCSYAGMYLRRAA